MIPSSRFVEETSFGSDHGLSALTGISHRRRRIPTALDRIVCQLYGF